MIRDQSKKCALGKLECVIISRHSIHPWFGFAIRGKTLICFLPTDNKSDPRIKRKPTNFSDPNGLQV